MRATLLLCVLSIPATAHGLWLVPPETATIGQPITVRAISGTAFLVGDRAPDPGKFAARRVVAPDGTASAATAAGTAETAGLLAFTSSAAGVYVVAVETTPNVIALDAEAFNEYLVSDGLPHIFRLRAKERTLDKVAVERYSKSPKALVRVGDGRDPTRPVGLPLEIVPAADPFARSPGDTLRVRVLFRDKPLAGANLGWDHPGNGEHPAGSVRSDTQGEALVPIAKSGLMTIRLTHKTRPKVAENEWGSFWTTLTFHVSEQPRR